MEGKSRRAKVVETKAFLRVLVQLLPRVLLMRGMRSIDDPACPSGDCDDDEYDENKSCLSRQYARRATSYLLVKDTSSSIMSDEGARISGVSCV